MSSRRSNWEHLGPIDYFNRMFPKLDHKLHVTDNFGTCYHQIIWSLFCCRLFRGKMLSFIKIHSFIETDAELHFCFYFFTIQHNNQMWTIIWWKSSLLPFLSPSCPSPPLLPTPLLYDKFLRPTLLSPLFPMFWVTFSKKLMVWLESFKAGPEGLREWGSFTLHRECQKA